MEEMGSIRVPVDEAKEHHDQHGAIFLDVVDTGAYEQLDYQIGGAVRIAPEKIGEQFEQMPEDKAVFAYCT
jgi:rhodanese-related sulfurtransferase